MGLRRIDTQVAAVDGHARAEAWTELHCRAFAGELSAHCLAPLLRQFAVKCGANGHAGRPACRRTGVLVGPEAKTLRTVVQLQDWDAKTLIADNAAGVALA